MSTNPQWSKFQPPPIMNSDPSILDFKTLATINDDQSNYRGFANPFQTSIPSKNASNMIFGKSSSTPFNNHASYNGSSGMTFPIGTFSFSERSNSNSFSVNGDGFGSSHLNSVQSANSHFNSNANATAAAAAVAAATTMNSASAAATMNANNSSNDPLDSNPANQGIRETGIIEKLLHSYGFIQCCERQARLFFHFSQFSGNIEHLKIGDPVEFEMSYDRRTGKPIASAVSKIAPEVVGVVLSEERVTGTVTTEIKTEGSGQELQGRISYENRGECFFLPYNKDDVEGNVTLRSGDKVSFQIAANQRGNLGACHIRLENPAHPIKYQGVVCSMKESFGFIERADVVKEIFFHFSEAKLSAGDELRLGDDVQFIIQTRNGKEVACNITRLEPGSVVFEDVCTEIVKGQVLKPLERGQHSRQQEDALPGRIRYRAADHSEVEIPFGEKDQSGDFTLRHGDWVQFRIATDRRDQLQRAINISLMEESFLVSGERREQGIISALIDVFGFIKCADRDLKVFFHANEVLDVDREIQVDDEVEFTIVQDSLSSHSYNKQSAIRIKHLKPGTVKFETLVEENLTGVVAREAKTWGCISPRKMSPSRDEKSPDRGLINYQQGETKKSISYCHKDVESKSSPRLGDKVEFNIVQVKRNKKFHAVDVKVVSGKNQAGKIVNGVNSGGNGNGNGKSTPCQGFVAALKDGFGFIETASHDQEVFFHFRNIDGDADKLELCQEVEYSLGSRSSSGSCMSAENVKLLPKGTIPSPVCSGPLLDGVIVRPLRCFNPDQSHYAGLIQTVTEDEKSLEYEFGILGLTNKRELLQIGDPVQFQVDSEGRAANIVALRKKRKATVDAVKGHFGFLSYGAEEGKKIFFHVKEVKDGVMLQPGDTVEFNLVTNHRNGKTSACNVTKISESQQRPERLISRLRTISLDEGGRKLMVVRQPKGPDGTKGFSTSARSPRPPGAPITE